MNNQEFRLPMDCHDSPARTVRLPPHLTREPDRGIPAELLSPQTGGLGKGERLPLLRYLVRRLLVALPVLLGVTLLSYAIISLAPGDPVDLLIDPNMSAHDIEQMRIRLGLDKPWPVRYAKWLGELARGNLGYSYLTGRPVAERIAERVGPTLSLTLSAFLLTYLVAIPVGVIAATRQYSWIDYLTSFFALAGNSIPTFFLGLAMIYVFSLKLDLFPTGGSATLGGPGGWLDRLHHLVLPAVVLSTTGMGRTMRFVRSAMLEVTRQDFIRTAWAKGLSRRAVIYKHALRNALIPVVTLLGLELPTLIGGAVITESVFGWPGMGRLTIDAISQRDYPVIMALNLLTALMVLAGQLLTDLLYALVDPRIRYS